MFETRQNKHAKIITIPSCTVRLVYNGSFDCTIAIFTTVDSSRYHIHMENEY
jgi:hypothetical protein